MEGLLWKELTLYFDDIQYSSDFKVNCSKDESLNFTRKDVKVDGHGLDEFIAGKNETLNYRLFVPKNVEGEVPLVLSLHGAGVTGNDNIAQI